MQYTVALSRSLRQTSCRYSACSLHTTAILAITEKKEKDILSQNLGSDSGLQHACAAHVIRPNIHPAGNVIDTVSVGLKSHGPPQNPTVFQVRFLQEA